MVVRASFRWIAAAVLGLAVSLLLVVPFWQPVRRVELSSALTASNEVDRLRNIVRQQEHVIARETSLLENVENCNEGQVFVVGQDVKQIRCITSPQATTTMAAASEHQSKLRDEHKEWCQKWCLPEQSPHVICESCVDPSFPEYMKQVKKTENSNFGITIPVDPARRQHQEAATVQSLAISPANDAEDRVKQDVLRLEQDEKRLVRARVEADLRTAAGQALSSVASPQSHRAMTAPKQPTFAQESLPQHTQARSAVARPANFIVPHKGITKIVMPPRARGMLPAHRNALAHTALGRKCHTFSECFSAMFVGAPIRHQAARLATDPNADRRVPAERPAYHRPSRGGSRLATHGVNVRGWDTSTLVTSLKTAGMAGDLYDKKLKPSSMLTLQDHTPGFEDEHVEQRTSKSAEEYHPQAASNPPIARLGSAVAQTGDALSAAAGAAKSVFWTDRPTSAGHLLTHHSGDADNVYS